MPRVKELTNMEIDEISLVDRPANQHAKVVITKRDTQEETVPEEIYNEDGELLDTDALNEGDVVFDEEGQAFVVVDEEMSEEFEEVGKGLFGAAKAGFKSPKASMPFAPGTSGDKAAKVGQHFGRNKGKYAVGAGAGTAGAAGGYAVSKSFAEELREELSKSVTDMEKDEVIAKAFSQVEEMSKSMAEAQEIAKSERELRLVREYEEVAKSYNLPVESDELAPVLMAIAETLPYEYGEVIHKALSAAGEIIFNEIGYEGGGSNNDVLAQVDAYIDQNVSKSDISKSEAIEAVFLDNPDAYDEYMATRN